MSKPLHPEYLAWQAKLDNWVVTSKGKNAARMRSIYLGCATKDPDNQYAQTMATRIKEYDRTHCEADALYMGIDLED